MLLDTACYFLLIFFLDSPLSRPPPPPRAVFLIKIHSNPSLQRFVPLFPPPIRHVQLGFLLPSAQLTLD